jgi:hypothetical protein
VYGTLERSPGAPRCPQPKTYRTQLVSTFCLLEYFENYRNDSCQRRFIAGSSNLNYSVGLNDAQSPCRFEQGRFLRSLLCACKVVFHT